MTSRSFFLARVILFGIPLCAFAPGPTFASAPPADAACPAAFPAQPPPLSDERLAEVARLAGLGDPCRDRADYFAYQGMLMLTLKRAQEAALALEKALLLDPELAGAQLDYAQALAEIGELDSAVSLAGEVSKRPDIPIALQAWLAENLDAWQGNTWRADWWIDLMGGGESNLNSAPGIRSVSLTLPSGSVPLDLAPSARSRAGGALRTNLIGSALRPLGGGLLLFGGEFATRNSPGDADTNQHLVSASAAYVHPVLGGQLGVRVVQTRFWMGGDPAYVGSGWRLLYHLPEQFSVGGCVGRVGYGAEDIDFPGESLQAGRYTGAEAWLSCRGDDWQVDLGVLDGEDRARQASRPGGDQRRTDFSIGLMRRIGSSALSLWTLHRRATDEQVYSSLLGGVPRQVDRLTIRLFYEHPMGNQWSIIGYAETTSQNSNIALFKMDNNAIYFGVRWRGP